MISSRLGSRSGSRDSRDSRTSRSIAAHSDRACASRSHHDSLVSQEFRRFFRRQRRRVDLEHEREVELVAARQAFEMNMVDLCHFITDGSEHPGTIKTPMEHHRINSNAEVLIAKLSGRPWFQLSMGAASN